MISYLLCICTWFREAVSFAVWLKKNNGFENDHTDKQLLIW